MNTMELSPGTVCPAHSVCKKLQMYYWYHLSYRQHNFSITVECLLEVIRGLSYCQAIYCTTQSCTYSKQGA